MQTLELGLLAWVISWFASILLIASAWQKFCDLALFRSHLTAYDLLSPGWTEAMTYLLPISELIASLLLLISPSSGVGHGLAMGLMLLYGVAMAIKRLAGYRDLECGCSGAALRVSWGLVIRNTMLAALICLAACASQSLNETSHMVVAMGLGFLLWTAYALLEKSLSLLFKARRLQSIHAL
ncbi:MauE/DoxX family redox-associated membrane protein [Comamonas composti]|uniref:MauE/DoxX family redox-associated membrane protein n=1 Tax=Comamonas composti TaxID=408558 RepID=UPI00047BAC8A|nr:MauE/DoxX family redox-associated membrane protein [Comamonas composti]